MLNLFASLRKNFLPALVRALNLARKNGTRSIISHFKAIGQGIWKDFGKAISILERARKEGVDISFDVFPYLRTGSMLSALLPEWLRNESTDEILKKLNDKEFFQKIAKELKLLTLHPERILIASAARDKSLIGKTLEELTKRSGMGPEETLLNILIANDFMRLPIIALS